MFMYCSVHSPPKQSKSTEVAAGIEIDTMIDTAVEGVVQQTCIPHVSGTEFPLEIAPESSARRILALDPGADSKLD